MIVQASSPQDNDADIMKDVDIKTGGSDDEEDDEFNEDDENMVTTYMVVPPDGGWGWVVMVAAFFCNMMVDGNIFAFGMYMNSLMEEFDASSGAVSLVGSLLQGFYLLVGPLVSALANRYGFRVVAIIGSVIACFGFGISYYAQSVTYLYITYGVVGGIGFGMVYVPAVIAVGFYFERWRALATGIAVCGSGIGGSLIAPLVAKVIELYSWRVAMLMQAALILTCILFGILFRPLEAVPVTINSKELEESQEKEVPLLQRIKVARDNQRLGSICSLSDTTSITAGSQRRMSRILGPNNNAYPTAADALSGSTLTLKERRKSSTYSLHQTNLGSGTVGAMTKYEKRMSAPPDSLLLMAKIAQENEAEVGLNPVKEERRDSKIYPRKIRRDSECSYGSVRSRKNSMQQPTVGVRPLYRDDILFTGSINQLPQYKTQQRRSSVGYHLSVTRLPTKKDIEEEETSKCIVCPEAVKRTLATMLDVSLLKSPSFLLLTLSGCFTLAGFYVPFMFIPGRAVESGIDPTVIALLIPGIGIANTAGRVVCGIVTSLPGANALIINNVALTAGGIAIIISGFSTETWFQITYCTIFGLAIACFASLRSIIIVDLLGLEKLTNAFGLLLLFQGFAAMIGPPLAGWFMEVTGSYDAAFWFSGSLILISAIITYPLNWVNRREKAKNSQLQAISV